MPRTEDVDFSRSLDELQGVESGNADDAPTPLVRDIILARRKPLADLTLGEIGQLFVQMEGLPYILDLAFPLLEADPLIDGGYYPGDILSCIIRADESIWHDRPALRQGLKALYQRAMSRPIEDKDIFLESLGIENDHFPH